MIHLFWSTAKTCFQKEWKNTAVIKELWMNTKVSSLGVQPKLWAWESRSQKFLLDSWLQKTGAWGKSKHSVQEQLKVRAAKKEYENMRSICWELCIYQQKALRKMCQEEEACRRICLRDKQEESCTEFGKSSTTYWWPFGVAKYWHIPSYIW